MSTNIFAMFSIYEANLWWLYNLCLDLLNVTHPTNINSMVCDNERMVWLDQTQVIYTTFGRLIG